MYDTFLIWLHGLSKWLDFVQFLNSRHKNIRFTMDLEQEGLIPFLDVILYRKDDGLLGRKMHQKHTYTSLYLNSRSHHYSSQKSAMISTLTHTMMVVSDIPYMQQEQKSLEAIFLL